MGEFTRWLYRNYGNYFEKYTKYFDSLKLDLEMADIDVLIQEYVTFMFFTSIIAAFISFFICIPLLFFTTKNILISFVLAPFIAIFIGIAGFICTYFYPYLVISQKKKDVEDNIHFATTYLTIIAGTGAPLVSMFKILSKFEEYGEFAKISDKIVKDVELFGMDIITSIEKRAKKSPSENVRQLFWGIKTTVISGGDLKKYLQEKATAFTENYRRRLELYVEQISLFLEIYTIVVIVGSIFLVIMSALMGSIASPGGMSIEIVQVVAVYFLIPFSSIALIIIILSLSPKITKEKKFFNLAEKSTQIFIVSIVCASIFLLLDYLLFVDSTFIFAVGTIVAFLIATVPYTAFVTLEYQKIRKIEESMPLFLRDLAESKRSGMSIPNAINTLSKTNYGPLSDEITIMKNQLSWSVPFPQVIQYFKDRMENSPFIQRVLSIILQAEASGGKIPEILDSIARETSIIKSIEDERRSKITQQVAVIYMIFFIFLGIIIIIQTMTPMLIMQNTASSMSSSLMGTGFNMGTGSSMSITDITDLFRNTSLILAFFCGIIIGVTRDSSVVSGLKDSVFLLFLTLVVSLLFLTPVALQVLPQSTGLPSEIDPNTVYTEKGYVQSLERTYDNVNVSAELDGKTFYGEIDETGRYQIDVTSPEKAGKYKIKIIATGEKAKAEAERDIKVIGGTGT